MGAVIIALAVGLAVALVQIHKLEARQILTNRNVGQISQAVGTVGQSASANGGSVASVKSQLGTLQSQMQAITNQVSHYAMCLCVWTDNTGNVSAVNMSTPVYSNGVTSCPTGVIVSTVPTGG